MKSLLTASLLALMALSPVHSLANITASLSVISNNVYLLPEIIGLSQRTRAKLIAESDYIRGHDIVVLEECFSRTPCKILREGLLKEYPYQTPTVGSSPKEWNSTTGGYSAFSLANGGVVILSKWPIKERHQFIYSGTCGSDWLSNKGVAYVVLDYQGTNLHVFGTHMQSDDERCFSGQSQKVRAREAASWRKFIDSHQIPADETVILAGDFNIERNSVEYQTTVIDTLNVDHTELSDGEEPTWDPKLNQLAHLNSPSVKEGHFIDYIFVDKKHSSKVQSIAQRTLRVHSTDYAMGRRTLEDFSDHFPIQASIQLDFSDTLVAKVKSTANRK